MRVNRTAPGFLNSRIAPYSRAMKGFVFTVPLETVSLNVREHSMARHRRVRKERAAVAFAFPLWARNVMERRWDKCAVHFIRFGKRRLDSDNLVGSMKAVRDEVSAQLGIDDGSPRIAFTYDQATAGAYAVTVLVTRVGEALA